MSDADEPTGSAPFSRPARPSPYGESPYALRVDAPPAATHRRRLVALADVWLALAGTVGVVIVGVLAALAWVAVSPRTSATVAKSGSGRGQLSVSLNQPETKDFAAADVRFLFVTTAAALVCAAVGLLIARRRALPLTVAMAGGGTLAALVAAWLGRYLTGGPVHRWAMHTASGSHQYFVQLQTRPYVMAWPVVALAVIFLVTLASSPHEAPQPVTGDPRPPADGWQL